MNVLARRGDQLLVDLGNDRGAIYDSAAELYGPVASIPSLLKTGYWHDPESLTSAANADYSDSAMIAIYPPPDAVDKFQLEGGEDRAQLHLTLVFLGKVADLDPDEVNEIVTRVAGESSPFMIHVGGYAVFQTDDGRCLVALADSPELEQLQQRLHDELANHVSFPDNHGFTAHVTLKYLDEDEVIDPAWFARPTFDFTVSGICAKFGDDRHDSVLTGRPA